jgi:HAD superfamily hydrolase (TIGR01509 family)
MRTAGLIDLDGVLVDTEPLHMKSWQAAAAALGIPLQGLRFEEFRGVSEAAVAARLRARAGAGAPAVEEVVKLKQGAYEDLRDEIDLVAGAREFLEACRDAGVRLGLVTSGLRHNQRFVFERFGLGAYFAGVVTGEDVTHGKPSPEPYERCLSLLDAEPGAAFAVEDSLAGVASAKAAGCFVVAVAHTFAGAQLLQAEADLVAPTIAHVGRWVALAAGR